MDETTNEHVLAEVVRAWASRSCTADPAAATLAAGAAVAAYRSGASVVEACSKARSLLAARDRHPAGDPAKRAAGPLAS
jgi:hypothetical protein